MRPGRLCTWATRFHTVGAKSPAQQHDNAANATIPNKEIRTTTEDEEGNRVLPRYYLQAAQGIDRFYTHQGVCRSANTYGGQGCQRTRKVLAPRHVAQQGREIPRGHMLLDHIRLLPWHVKTPHPPAIRPRHRASAGYRWHADSAAKRGPPQRAPTGSTLRVGLGGSGPRRAAQWSP